MPRSSDIHRVVLTGLLVFAASSATLAEGKKNTWEFFDYGEERGWSNENDAGNAVAIYGCIRQPKSSAAILRATGYMDKYAEGKIGDFSVTVEMSDFADQVFMAPSEYFGIEFLFQVQLPADVKTSRLKICARSMTGTPAEPECNEFTGPHFAEMIADLCD